MKRETIEVANHHFGDIQEIPAIIPITFHERLNLREIWTEISKDINLIRNERNNPSDKPNEASKNNRINKDRKKAVPFQERANIVPRNREESANQHHRRSDDEDGDE